MANELFVMPPSSSSAFSAYNQWVQVLWKPPYGVHLEKPLGVFSIGCSQVSFAKTLDNYLCKAPQI
jgi:hypothetical protein